MKKSNLEIVGRSITNETYLSSYSTTIFNVYEIQIIFDGYYTQNAFCIRPKNEDGVQLRVEYWFADFAKCQAFMRLYNSYHSMRFWLMRQSNLNTKFSVLYLKWLSKVMKRI